MYIIYLYLPKHYWNDRELVIQTLIIIRLYISNISRITLPLTYYDLIRLVQENQWTIFSVICAITKLLMSLKIYIPHNPNLVDETCIGC